MTQFTNSVVTPQATALIGQASENLNATAQRQLEGAIADQEAALQREAMAMQAQQSQADRALQLQLADIQTQQYENLNKSKNEQLDKELAAREAEMQKQREFEKWMFDERNRLDLEMKKLDREMETAKLSGDRKAIIAVRQKWQKVSKQQAEIDVRLGTLGKILDALRGDVVAVDVKGMTDALTQRAIMRAGLETATNTAVGSAINNAFANIVTRKGEGEFSKESYLSTAGKIDKFKSEKFPFLSSITGGAGDLAESEMSGTKRQRDISLALGDALLRGIDQEAYAGKPSAAFNEFMSAVFEQSFVRSSGGEGNTEKLTEMAAKAKAEMGDEVFGRLAWTIADQLDARVEEIGLNDESGQAGGAANNSLRALSLTDSVLVGVGVKKPPTGDAADAGVMEIHDRMVSALKNLQPDKFAEIVARETENLEGADLEAYAKRIKEAGKRMEEVRRAQTEEESLKKQKMDLVLGMEQAVTDIFSSLVPEELDVATEGLDQLLEGL